MLLGPWPSTRLLCLAKFLHHSTSHPVHLPSGKMNEDVFDPIALLYRRIQVLEDPVSKSKPESPIFKPAYKPDPVYLDREGIFHRRNLVNKSQVQPAEPGKIPSVRPDVCSSCNKRQDVTPNSNTSDNPQTLYGLDGDRFECAQCASFSKLTMVDQGKDQGIPQMEPRKLSTNDIQKVRRLTNPSSHLPQEPSQHTPQNDTGNVLQVRIYDPSSNKFQSAPHPFQAFIDRPKKPQLPSAPSKPGLPRMSYLPNHPNLRTVSKLPKVPKLPKAAKPPRIQKPPRIPKPPRIEKPQKEPPVPVVFKHTKWEEMIKSLKSDAIVHAQYLPFH
jgi:hypothetical protein